MTAAPLLVLGKSDPPSAHHHYLAEMLRLEGFNWLRERDLCQQPLTEAETLPEVVLLGALDLDEETAGRVARHVSDGGTLLAGRPCAALAAALGLRRPIPLWPERLGAYVLLEEQHPAVAALPWVTAGVQCLAPAATLLAESSANLDVCAWLAPFPGQRSRFPAALEGRLGRGRFVVLAFDPGESALRQQQGTPAQASTGSLPDFDGDATFRPNDLFLGQLDPALRDIPQADLQRSLLVRLVELLTDEAPLPRLWRFPNGAPAAGLIDGDSDGMTLGDFRLAIGTCDRYGAPFGTYLKPEHVAMVEPAEVHVLRSRGHAFGPHPWAGPQPAPDELRRVLEADCAGFEARYGYRPRIHRGHWLIWPGWVDHATSLASAGIRLDANFTAGRNFQGGYVNGSGLPVRFATPDGTLLDVAEQSTISTDDGWLLGKSGLSALSLAEVITRSCRQIDDAIDRYHTVYHPYFHPVLLKGGRAPPYPTLPWLEALLAHCKVRGLAVLEAERWIDWLEARRQIELLHLDRLPGGARLSLRSRLAVDGLTVLWPLPSGRTEVHGAVDGARLGPDDVQIAVRHGRRYVAATLSLRAGETLDLEVGFS